jgi:hypothetical protein
MDFAFASTASAAPFQAVAAAWSVGEAVHCGVAFIVEVIERVRAILSVSVFFDFRMTGVALSIGFAFLVLTFFWMTFV